MGRAISGERGDVRRPPDLIDMLIAGTAKANGLTIATRNVQDFEGFGVEVVNLWRTG